MSLNLYLIDKASFKVGIPCDFWEMSRGIPTLSLMSQATIEPRHFVADVVYSNRRNISVFPGLSTGIQIVYNFIIHICNSQDLTVFVVVCMFLSFWSFTSLKKKIITFILTFYQVIFISMHRPDLGFTY